jgi:hypothetical protein
VTVKGAAVLKIVALDCDGTLIHGSPKGPIDPGALREKGYFTILVSASPNCRDITTFDDVLPSHGDDAVPSRCRIKSLFEIRKKYPRASEYVYISDNAGDDIISHKAGFTFLHPDDVRDGRFPP